MLKKLSGRTHSVYTGVSIIAPTEVRHFFEKTDVVFWELSDEEIIQYMTKCEPFDKAGAYGIQGVRQYACQKNNTEIILRLSVFLFHERSEN